MRTSLLFGTLLALIPAATNAAPVHDVKRAYELIQGTFVAGQGWVPTATVLLHDEAKATALADGSIGYVISKPSTEKRLVPFLSTPSSSSADSTMPDDNFREALSDNLNHPTVQKRLTPFLTTSGSTGAPMPLDLQIAATEELAEARVSKGGKRRLANE